MQTIHASKLMRREEKYGSHMLQPSRSFQVLPQCGGDLIYSTGPNSTLQSCPGGRAAAAELSQRASGEVELCVPEKAYEESLLGKKLA